MADKHSSRYKSSSKYKHRHASKSDSKHNRYKSKTPPLSEKIDSSMKALLEKRKLLQDKLKTLQSTSKNTDVKENKSVKLPKSSNNINRHKKDLIENKNTNHNKLDKDLTLSLYDSDEEEHIIAERRQKRKQLIEKLNLAQTENKVIDIPDIVEKSDNNINLIEKCHKEDTAMQMADMFSEKDDFDIKISEFNQTKAQMINECDDSEGYLNIQIGEKIYNSQYSIKSILGQGVFANVVHAVNNSNNANVAIKIIRNNSLMYTTGQKEVKVLKKLSCADPDNRYHCVKFFCDFVYRNHLCLVFELLHMDLRHLIKKYGRNYGISSKALVSYSRQLFMALRLLKKNGLVHADIKPDNILVNENKNILKLCDFGSTIDSGDNEVTPYLVSRFYRAPEIILGVPPYTYAIDTWSAACTVYEMATGKIMFTGSSNNKMLKCFMDMKGKIPNKIMRRGKFRDLHFNSNNDFLYLKTDPLSGKEKVVELSDVKIVRDISSELKKAQLEAKKLSQLKDLLNNMLMFDSNKRLPISECLKHPFIVE